MIKARLTPQEDMTAYELCLILMAQRFGRIAHVADYSQWIFTREGWDAMRDDIKRHFTPLTGQKEEEG